MNVSPKERTEYIGIRVTPEEKLLIQKAAEFVGISMTEFLVVSAMLQAKRFYKLYEELGKTIQDFLDKWGRNT